MATEDEGSVTRRLDAVKAGDPAAAQRLWERFCTDLIRLARARLRAAPRAAEDEEDVALSAFDSFFAAAARGRFPRLGDRHDLWRVLITVTERKAFDLLRRQAHRVPAGVGADLLDGVAGAEPTPEFAAMIAEEYRRRLDTLPDETLRRVAVLKMAGDTNPEVAARLGCGLRSVDRKLRLIRRMWLAEGPPCGGTLGRHRPGPGKPASQGRGTELSDPRTTSPMDNHVLLRLDGAVARPLDLTFEDLRGLPPEDQVSDVSRFHPGRRGDGVTLEALLQWARPSPEANYLTLHAGRDDFHVSIPLAAVRGEGLVVYHRAGERLEVEQGGPIRFLIKDPAACHTDELDDCANVKYLDRIELTVRRGRDTRPADEEAHARLHDGASS